MRRLISALLFAAALRAQTPPSFEAVSLTPSGPDSKGQVTQSPGQVIWTRATLKQLISVAFGLKDYSFAPPAWLDSTEYDLAAKIPAGTPPTAWTKMLQTLLVERFKLTYHYEPRTTNGYALVVARDGFKLKPSAGGDQGGTGRPGMVRIKNTTLAFFASALASLLKCPVSDMTGISGVYDIELTWTPDAGAPDMSAGATPAPSDPGPSLFAAIQEQLGLKLESRKLPVDVLVIDHAERSPVEK